jgi:hypothetical protein
MAHTLQEKYSKLVDIRARKQLVTKDEMIFNTRYEGDATAGAVKIPTRAEVVVGDYNKATGIAPTEGSTTYITVTINKDKAINEVIDGFDAASVPDGIVADRIDSAGYSMANTLDADGIAVLEAEGKTIVDELDAPDTTALTVATAYDYLVDTAASLTKSNVPVSDRFLLVSADLHAVLLKDKDNFIKQGDLSQKLVEEGVVGKIAGFNVFVSNNLAADTEFIAGHKDFATRVQAWSVPVKVVDLSGSGKYIGASAVQGRKVYAHKVTKAEAVLVKKFV